MIIEMQKLRFNDFKVLLTLAPNAKISLRQPGDPGSLKNFRPMALLAFFSEGSPFIGRDS